MGMRQIRRRGLMAGLAALVGAGAAKLAGPGRAEAALNDPIRLGVTSQTSDSANPNTRIFNASATALAAFLFRAENYSNSSLSLPANTRIALAGTTSGSDTTPGVTKIGVLGATDANGIGLHGTSVSGSGIEGRSTSGDGILGFSSGNLKYGLAGNGSGQAHGLIGNSANQFGIAGINSGGNNWAGAFFNAQANSPGAGKKGLFVQGDFLVLNGTKNAGVKTQRFGHRKMYAVEATENVFEDFGTASVKNGTARVDLDEIFAETVNTGPKYQVYLTPKHADSKGLAVVGQDAKGFTIQELGGGTGNYEVDYRIVAKVKGYEQTRMEQFDPPTMPTSPTAAPLPVPTAGPGDKKEKP